MEDYPLKAAQLIQSKIPADFKPVVGMVLGSGLTPLAEMIDVVAKFDYSDLPGFFKSTIPGHDGELILGYLDNTAVACLSGRVHVYEGTTADQICTPIRTMKRLGCHTLLITNASGGINPNYLPGDVVMIKDQINASGTNPLVGENDENYGPRFPAMENAFDAEIRKMVIAKADRLHMKLMEGTYIGVLGPVYESPAEIKMYKSWGADLIGMSTVNEVIVARHCGLKVLALGAIANAAAGTSENVVNHEEVLVFGKVASEAMQKLILGILHKL